MECKSGLIPLRHLTKKECKQIGKEIAEAFLGEANMFSENLTREECIRYFQIITDYYCHAGCLYASSPAQEGWIAYYTQSQSPGFFSTIWMGIRLFLSIPYTSLMKTGQVPSGWIYYKDLYAEKSDFIDVAMVAVKKSCQGQGYLHTLLAEPMALARQKKIPCILETDNSRNAAKYQHCGFTSVQDMAFGDTIHLYAMEYGGE
jgi:GNAT superfamily N-acetyltransferase